METVDKKAGVHIELSKKELEACHWSQDCLGIFKQYNPIKTRWDVRVLGRHMKLKPWESRTKLLRAFDTEKDADALVSRMAEVGATVWHFDSNGLLTLG